MINFDNNWFIAIVSASENGFIRIHDEMDFLIEAGVKQGEPM